MEFQEGKPAEDICRKYGISRATLYNWKENFNDLVDKNLKRHEELKEKKRVLSEKYEELKKKHEIVEFILKNIK